MQQEKQCQKKNIEKRKINKKKLQVRQPKGSVWLFGGMLPMLLHVPAGLAVVPQCLLHYALLLPLLLLLLPGSNLAAIMHESWLDIQREIIWKWWQFAIGARVDNPSQKDRLGCIEEPQLPGPPLDIHMYLHLARATFYNTPDPVVAATNAIFPVPSSDPHGNCLTVLPFWLISHQNLKPKSAELLAKQLPLGGRSGSQFVPQAFNWRDSIHLIRLCGQSQPNERWAKWWLDITAKAQGIMQRESQKNHNNYKNL